MKPKAKLTLSSHLFRDFAITVECDLADVPTAAREMTRAVRKHDRKIQKHMVEMMEPLEGLQIVAVDDVVGKQTAGEC